MMPNFKPRLGTKFQVQTAPVNDGQFIVATDSRELFYDNGTLRIPLADIVFLNTEEERASILAPGDEEKASLLFLQRLTTLGYARFEPDANEVDTEHPMPPMPRIPKKQVPSPK